MAKIGFYIGDNDKYIVVIEDGAVPRAGEYINIRKTTYLVDYVTWAIDNIDYISDRKNRSLRANVVLREIAS